MIMNFCKIKKHCKMVEKTINLYYSIIAAPLEIKGAFINFKGQPRGFIHRLLSKKSSYQKTK